MSVSRFSDTICYHPDLNKIRGKIIESLRVYEEKPIPSTSKMEMSKEIERLNNIILRFEHFAEVVVENPEWNDHHCRAKAILDAYKANKPLNKG